VGIIGHDWFKDVIYIILLFMIATLIMCNNLIKKVSDYPKKHYADWRSVSYIAKCEKQKGLLYIHETQIAWIRKRFCSKK